MDRMLYIGMSGAKETLLAQQLNNNNLANVSTRGFKADLLQARSMPVFGDGFPSRVFGMTERPATDFSEGSVESTGRALDMAVSGKGWITIEGKDGENAFTRAGNFRVSPEGFLLTGSGYRVIGSGGPILIPQVENMTIGNDGVISILPIGQNAATLAVLDRIKLVNPANGELEKRQDGLMYYKQDGQLPLDNEVRLISGVLERSNVNIVDTMVNMVTLSRSFEFHSKIMKTAEDIDKSATSLLRMS